MSLFLWFSNTVLKLQLFITLSFFSLLENGLWKGTVKIPLEYFPPNVDTFNAYSIHGTEPSRIYKSLFAVPGPHPDFHRLNCFKPFDLIRQNEMSDFWKSHLEEKNKSSWKYTLGMIVQNVKMVLKVVMVFENHRKSLIQHCERSELRLHSEWTKVN